MGINIIHNAFFYCLHKGLFLYTKGENTNYSLDNRATGYLAKIVNKKIGDINNLFFTLAKIYENNVNLGIEHIMSDIDYVINSKRLISHASGF